MPEGDTIRRLAERVETRLAGAVVERSVFRHPRLATLDLTGRRLLGAASTGKHLFVRFDDDTSLHVHLLMQGRVRFDGGRDVPAWRRRFELVLRFDGDDRTRRMTGVDIPLLHHVATNREGSFTDHLGPDVCGDFDPDAALDRILARPDLPLGGAMLDQRNVAGWGNIYAVETPFVCGLSPFRRVGDIDDLRPVIAIGAALIRTNADRGPQNTTGRRLATGDHWILPARRIECPICGDRLDRYDAFDVTWQRRTVRCPTCQPHDAHQADLDRARRLLALHPAARRIDWTDLGSSTESAR